MLLDPKQGTHEANARFKLKDLINQKLHIVSALAAKFGSRALANQHLALLVLKLLDLFLLKLIVLKHRVVGPVSTPRAEQLLLSKEIFVVAQLKPLIFADFVQIYSL